MHVTQRTFPNHPRFYLHVHVATCYGSNKITQLFDARNRNCKITFFLGVINISSSSLSSIFPISSLSSLVSSSLSSSSLPGLYSSSNQRNNYNTLQTTYQRILRVHVASCTCTSFRLVGNGFISKIIVAVTLRWYSTLIFTHRKFQNVLV